MGNETTQEQRSGVRRRSVASSRRGATPPTAPVTTQNNFASFDEEPQGRARVRSMSMQHEPGDPAIAQYGSGQSDSYNPTIGEHALAWFNWANKPSAVVKRRYARSSINSASASLGSTNTSPMSSTTPSRRPSGGEGAHVGTRLAHRQYDLSPAPRAQSPAARETQPQAQETAQNDPRQPAASTSTSGYSVQRLPTFTERIVEPEAILLTELVTNITGLLSTLVESGPIDYVTGRAVGPLGMANAAQLFESNWANAGDAPVSRVGVLASIGSGSAAVMSTWTGWWSNEAADFHSRFGAIAGIASEIADVRDAWEGRNDNPARSAALMIRILSIWAASISTLLSISEAENEGSMAPTYGLSASVSPVVGTLAGAAAEALNRESVRNRLRAVVDRIRSLIRQLMQLFGYGEHTAPLMHLDPSPV
jgi:hypothetical protein